MKFETTGHQPASPAGGSADGTFDVMPEAVYAILQDTQSMASEFEPLFAAAGQGIQNLSEACKAPPITRELSTFYTFLLARTLRSAAGRTNVATGAVSEAVLALTNADGQMSETASRAAAQAAQERADDAPGAAGRPGRVGHGPAQAF